MLERNRSKRSANWLVWIVGALLILIAGYGIYFGISEQARYDQAARDGASEYARDARKKAEQPCNVLTNREQVQCRTTAEREYKGAAREKRREYADLVAQQKSALWTSIMGVAAITGMILSVVGVALVWTTFRATRQANEIARAALEAQTRPWIKLAVQIYNAQREGGTVKAKVKVGAVNLGNGPANYVSLVPTILDGEWSTARILNAVPSFFDDGRVDYNSPIRGLNLHDRILFQQEDWNYHCEIEATNFPEDCRVGCVVVALRYNASGNPQPHYTTLVFDMAWRKAVRTEKGARKEVDVMFFEERASFSAYAD